MVGRGQGRSILLLAEDADPGRLQSWLVHLSGDSVVVAAREADPEWQLEDHGARFVPLGDAPLTHCVHGLPELDAVISLVPVAELADAFFATFPTLRVDGVFVHDRVAAPGALGEFVDSIGVLDGQQYEAPGVRPRNLAHGVSQFVVGQNLAAVRATRTFVWKLTDTEVEDLLPLREAEVSVEVLEEKPAGECVGSGVVDAGDFGAERFPQTLPHPVLRNRVYRGPLVLGGNSLLYSGRTAMPDSFRWYRSRNAMNPALLDTHRSFAVLRHRAKPQRHLPGIYYNLDNTYPHHFGHLMTEVISRLWGWDEAKRRHPDLKAAFHRAPYLPRRGRAGDPALERAVFGAYGIAREDMVVLEEPVSVDAVVSAMPMWHHAEPHHVHPGMREVIERLADGLAPAPAGDGPEKLFVSRSEFTKVRVCRNTAEVERHFADRGFEIVYPEKLHISEQARLFRGARVVAGFGGSAMFNMMFADHLEHLIVLSHELYDTQNEHMLSLLRGNDEHYFWSTPDRELGPGVRPVWARMSPWEFDFERNGARLEELLRNC